MNTADWDAVTRDQSVFLGRAYQEVLCATGPRTLQSRYGLIYGGKEVVAALVAHRIDLPHQPLAREMRVSPDSVVYPGLGADSDWIRSTRPVHTQQRKILVCGDFFVSGFHGIAVRPDVELGQVWPSVTGFLSRVQRQDRFESERDCVFIKDVHASLSSDPRALRACQYQRMNTSTTMVLKMPSRWNDYTDYLNHLNVRHRMGAYRVARDLGRADVVTRKLTHLEIESRRIHELYRAVQRENRLGLAELPVGFLSALATRLGEDDFRCSTFYRGEELVAFVFTVRDRETAVCYCLGWDPERCAGLPMLPALLQATIGDALSLGCHQIDFGRTALKAKAQVGAHPEASDIWVQQNAQDMPNWLHEVVEPIAHAPRPDPVLALSL